MLPKNIVYSQIFYLHLVHIFEFAGMKGQHSRQSVSERVLLGFVIHEAAVQREYQSRLEHLLLIALLPTVPSR